MAGRQESGQKELKDGELDGRCALRTHLTHTRFRASQRCRPGDRTVIDDGTLSTISGVPQVHFHREGTSLEAAIRSAIANIKSAGFDVARVEIEPQALARTA